MASDFIKTMLKKVISGGQTGIDTIGLVTAKECGIDTGGEMPNTFRTEHGPDPHKAKIYGLTESADYNYIPRTQKNIKDSDGTVIFGDIGSIGSKATVNYCRAFQKPYVTNPTAQELIVFVATREIEVLNVAGNRESVLSVEDADTAYYVMSEAFKQLK